MLHLFLADDLWDALQSETASGNTKLQRRDVWAFCPACQTSYDFSLYNRKFVTSSSSELIKHKLREEKDSRVDEGTEGQTDIE
jgi:hypothetical protein